MKRTMKFGVVFIIIVVLISGMFTVSAEYSVSQEVTSSVFSLPGNTIEGKMDMVLKGNTYTNLIEGSNMDSDSDGNGIVDSFAPNSTSGEGADFSVENDSQKITLNTANSDGYSFVYQSIQGFNEGDILAFGVEYKTNSTAGSSFKANAVVYFLDSNNSCIGFKEVYGTSSAGFKRFKIENIILPANTVKLKIELRARVGMDTSSRGTVWYKNVLLIKENTLKNYIPSGTKSAQSLNIKSVGKNLFNNKIEDLTKNSWNNTNLFFDSTYINYISSGGELTNSYRRKIQLKSNTQYTVGFKNLSGDFANILIDYRISGSIHYVSDTEMNETFTTDSTGIVEMGFVTEGQNSSANAKFNIMLQEGVDSTEYEQYIESKINNLEGLELNSLPNGVQDEVDFNNSIFVKRIGKCVLDGSFDWQRNFDKIGYKEVRISNTEFANAAKNYGTILFKDNEIPLNYDGTTGAITIDRDHYRTYEPNDFFLIAISDADSGWSDTYYPSSQDIKNYFNQHPYKIYYQLAQPETIQLTPQNLIAYPNGTIIVQTEDVSTLPTIAYSVPIDTGSSVDNLVEQVTGLFDMVNNNSEAIRSLQKNTPSIAPIYINCTQDKEINVALTVANIRDIDQRTFTVTYNTNDFDLQDLCTSTNTLENNTINSTYPIDGTDVVILENTIDGTVGKVRFRVNKYVSYGNSWSGVVNTLALKANGSGQKSITFEVE